MWSYWLQPCHSGFVWCFFTSSNYSVVCLSPFLRQATHSLTEIICYIIQISYLYSYNLPCSKAYVYTVLHKLKINIENLQYAFSECVSGAHCSITIKEYSFVYFSFRGWLWRLFVFVKIFNWFWCFEILFDYLIWEYHKLFPLSNIVYCRLTVPRAWKMSLFCYLDCSSDLLDIRFHICKQRW